MTPAETRDFADLVAVLWPSFSPPATSMAAQVWSAKLAPVDASAAVAAVDAISAEGSSFAPPLGAILLRVDRDGGGCPSSLDAWQEISVLVAAGAFALNAGPLNAEAFSHPLVYRVAVTNRNRIRNGNERFIGKEIAKAYEAAASAFLADGTLPEAPFNAVAELVEFVNPVDPMTALQDAKAALAAAKARNVNEEETQP